MRRNFHELSDKCQGLYAFAVCKKGLRHGFQIFCSEGKDKQFSCNGAAWLWRKCFLLHCFFAEVFEQGGAVGARHAKVFVSHNHGVAFEH